LEQFQALPGLFGRHRRRTDPDEILANRPPRPQTATRLHRKPVASKNFMLSMR
jgi:hypothetical protein